MPVSVRQDIRQFLIRHFTIVEHQTTIEECLNAYITARQLDSRYYLKKNEVKTSKKSSKTHRVRLRDQISQELGVLKQMGLIGRARYGVYVPKISD